jgi:hypothetical protein
MKLFKLFLIIMFLTASTLSFAESIFLKDGSIFEGKIIKETDKSATIDTGWGKTREILRKDVLRIIFDLEYKNKKYIYKKGGEVLEAFIVNENFETYTYRTELLSIKETIIYKLQVDFVSKIKLESSKAISSVPEKKQLFNRLLGFKIGPLFSFANSTTHPESMFVPGFDFGIGFFDQIFEFEMSMSIGFSGMNTAQNKQFSIFSRLNSNFIFGNVFGFGLGYFVAGSKNEKWLSYPNMDLFHQGLTLGPVLRIPNILHVTFLMLIPFGSSIYYNTSGNVANFNANFNFNMLLSVDVYVWKTLSVGITYILMGGEFSRQQDSSPNQPPYSKILFYTHQIILNVGYGFNL